MKIVSLEISNILSIESASFSFSYSGMVLVEGWNHDEGRANGAGKTSIFNALTFALYDKLPRKVTATEILRRGCRTGYAKVVLQVGADSWSVVRSRPKGVVFEKNGVAQSITQQEWAKILRLTYEQFIVSMYNSQGNSQRFLLLNDSDKKDFLLRLLDLEEFSSCKKIADDKVKILSTQLEKDVNEHTGLASKIEAYSESSIDEQQVRLAMKNDEDAIANYNLQILALQSVSKPDLAKYLKLEQDIKQKQSSFTAARTKRSMLHDQYRKLSSKLKPFEGDSSCFACGAVVDLSEAKKHHEQEMASIREELAAIKSDIDACDAALQKEQEVTNLSQKIADKKSKESEEYESALDQIREYRTLIKTKTVNIDNALLKLKTNSELLSKIKQLTTKLDTCSLLIANNKRDIELYKTISSTYAPTGAPAYVLDYVIESFNDSVADYINIIWPSASYALHSHKENSKGELVAKFSETLTMNGKEVSVGSLSGGELKALTLCADFAVLDVLEKHFGLPLNPVVLDEPFDGLDDIGRELVIELLDRLSHARQIFVIDHASEAKAMFSKIIKVEKRNEVSTVTVEP